MDLFTALYGGENLGLYTPQAHDLGTQNPNCTYTRTPADVVCAPHRFHRYQCDPLSTSPPTRAFWVG